MTGFTPVSSTVGGMLIGLAAVILMTLSGRIAGISGILARLLPPYADRELGARIAFIAGLIVAPLLYTALTRQPVVQTVSANLPLMVASGLLVGVGTTFASGCTSGHGVCGLSRFSVRSLAAVATFMAAGFATVFVIRHVLGG